MSQPFTNNGASTPIYFFSFTEVTRIYFLEINLVFDVAGGED